MIGVVGLVSGGDSPDVDSHQSQTNHALHHYLKMVANAPEFGRGVLRRQLQVLICNQERQRRVGQRPRGRQPPRHEGLLSWVRLLVRPGEQPWVAEEPYCGHDAVRARVGEGGLGVAAGAAVSVHEHGDAHGLTHGCRVRWGCVSAWV